MIQYIINIVVIQVANFKMEDFNKEMLTKRPRIDPGQMLRREIKDLNTTLVRNDRDGTQSMDSIAENIKRILDILSEITKNKLDIQTEGLYREAIHDLLSVGPLTRTEIPLDVLNQLISVGFEINCTDTNGYMCLDIAAERHHYNAIRLLVKHGARSNIANQDMSRYMQPPVTSLAKQNEVPLDLFDLLATPEDLNNNYYCSASPFLLLPLHTAVSHGHIQTALHLIKLGASVDQLDRLCKLPIEYLVEKQSDLLNNELFMSLLPQKAHGVPILKTILMLQGHRRPDKDNAYLVEMLHQLLQRLHFNEPLRVEFKTVSSHQCRHVPVSLPFKFSLHMAINNVEVCTSRRYNSSPMFLAMYLGSLILVKLQTDFISTPREIVDRFKQSAAKKMLTNVHPIDCVWRCYRQQCHVKSLLRLCILCTRSSMSSLDDANFMSLPVPLYIRKLLTYRDIAEEIFEEWCHGPTISS